MALKNILLSSFLLAVLILTNACAPRQDFNSKVGDIVKPYALNLWGWEWRAIGYECKQALTKPAKSDPVEIVKQYFLLTQQINTLSSKTDAGSQEHLVALKKQKLDIQGDVEKILAAQITGELSAQGIHNPGLNLFINFPAVNFKLEEPPHIFVISPRDKIGIIQEHTLKQEIAVEDRESIESQTDALGVSSLVVEIGGLGATVPAFVTNDMGLRDTLETASEEWLHQYLTFKPLGFRYVLDLLNIRQDYDIVTMNETLAGIASKEIGDAVYQKYYAGFEKEPVRNPGGFDFNMEMRETRRKVDALLARGEVKQAEDFMEQERQFLLTKGYNIRKLNQAYFAFNGTYADEPTSINPIGIYMRALRAKIPQLREFLNTAALITTRQELEKKTGVVTAGVISGRTAN